MLGYFILIVTGWYRTFTQGQSIPYSVLPFRFVGLQSWSSWSNLMILFFGLTRNSNEINRVEGFCISTDTRVSSNALSTFTSMEFSDEKMNRKIIFFCKGLGQLNTDKSTPVRFEWNLAYQFLVPFETKNDLWSFGFNPVTLLTSWKGSKVKCALYH